MQTSPRTPWLPTEIALLRERFPHIRTAELATALGKKTAAVSRKAHQLELRKSAAYLASLAAFRLNGIIGTKTRFKKGQTPWNQGIPGSCGTHKNSRATQFKKGRPAHESANYAPIGSTRITRDGYLELKFTDDPTLYPARRWSLIHRDIWEAKHGPITKSHIIAFRAGQKTAELKNITVDKLEILTQAENMRRNSVHSQYPPEIARVVQLRGALTRQINRITKTQNTNQK